MFVYCTDLQFDQIATVDVPKDNGFDPQTLKARFRVIGDDEAEKFNMSEVGSTKDFLRRVIVSLGDMQDAQGQPLLYSDAVRDLLLDLPFVRLALVRVYFSGVYKASEGN